MPKEKSSANDQSKVGKRDPQRKEQEKKVAKFLQSLPKGASKYSLKSLAAKLYKVFGLHQDYVLNNLRDGALIASIRWPSDRTVRIPPVLWEDFPDEEFKIGWLRKKTWRRGNCRIPLESLKQHLAQPLLQIVTDLENGKGPRDTSAVSYVLGLSQSEIIETLEREKDAFLISVRSQAMEMMSSENNKRRPCVSAADLEVFAYRTLGPAYRESRAGRPRTGKPEELVLQAVQQIEAHRRALRDMPFKLPNQARFAENLHKWWNDPARVPPRPTYGIELILKWVKIVYSAYNTNDLE